MRALTFREKKKDRCEMSFSKLKIPPWRRSKTQRVGHAQPMGNRSLNTACMETWQPLKVIVSRHKGEGSISLQNSWHVFLKRDNRMKHSN